MIIFTWGDRNLEFWNEATWQFSHGGEWKVDGDPLPILESFWGVHRTFCVVQAANGGRYTLLGDQMPVPAIVQGILELDAVGLTEGLAAAHAHLKLQEGRCRHVEVPGLGVTRFSCKKKKKSWVVAFNGPLFAIGHLCLERTCSGANKNPVLFEATFAPAITAFIWLAEAWTRGRLLIWKAWLSWRVFSLPVLQITRHGSVFRERFYCSALRKPY